MQQVVVAHKALVDKILPLQSAIHILWRDAQPLGSALQSHRSEVDAVVGWCPAVCHFTHNAVVCRFRQQSYTNFC